MDWLRVVLGADAAPAPASALAPGPPRWPVREAERCDEPARLRSALVRHHARGEFAEAVAAARALVDWQRKTVGELHRDHARALTNLALLLQRVGDESEAQRVLARVVDIDRRTLGPDHAETRGAEALRVRPAADPRARAVLEAVDRLAGSGSDETEALRPCRAAAGALRAALQRGEAVEDAGRLVRGEHPLAVLVTFVERLGTLTDAEWARAHETVGAAFGPDLARAASRGRVRLRP